MKKTDFILFSLLLVAGIAGWWMHNYAGGIITGSSLLLFMLATWGKRQAAKAAGKMDQAIYNAREELKNLQTTADA